MKPRSGVRFAGRDKLAHLIGDGEVVQRLGRGVADRRHRAVIQAGDGITDRNQTATLTLHDLFSHLPQTKEVFWFYESPSLFIRRCVYS